MYLGVDIGGMSIKAGLVDENYKLVKTDTITTNAGATDYEVVKDIAFLCKKILAENDLTVDDIPWIGLGIPGTPDNDRGLLVYANNLPFLNTPVRKIINEYIDKPVYIENDANCAALGEIYAGAAQGLDSAVILTIGTGLGGGIIINKKIWSGFNFSGGELGHMLLELDGEQCTCGRKGCIEAYASASALIRQTKHAMIDNPDSYMYTLTGGDVNKVDGKTAFDAMRQGDKTGKHVVDTFVKYLAAGVADLINIFAPEAILIGGGVSKEGETLLQPIREYVQSVSYNRCDKKTQILAAALGNNAGIIGASLLGK